MPRSAQLGPSRRRSSLITATHSVRWFWQVNGALNDQRTVHGAVVGDDHATTPVVGISDTPAASEAGAAVVHPEWCAPDRCTAAPEVDASGAHRGSPIRVATDGPLSNVSIVASLYQAHRRWQTSMLVDLEVSGLGRDWQAATVMATLDIEDAATLARTLAGTRRSRRSMAAAATDYYLTALRKEVST